jgi:hypothetical protein
MNAPRWSDYEIETLCKLCNEGYGAVFCAVTLGRTKRAVQKQAYRLGLRFKGKGNGRNIRITIRQDAFGVLEQVARELETDASRLASIAFTILAQRELWGALLKLGGPHYGPAEIE